jgi:hypothetical protein
MVSILAIGVVLDAWVYIAAGVAAAGIAGAGIVMKQKDKKKAAAKAAKLRSSR